MSPEVSNFVHKKLIPFRGRSYLRQCLPSKPHEWGLTCEDVVVLVDFFVTYDEYQDVSNKSNSTFDVSSNVVANLSSTLPNQENHKMFGGNYFAKSPLIAHNKSDGIWYTATIHAPPLKIYSLLAEVDVKKGRGSFDYPTEENMKIVVTK